MTMIAGDIHTYNTINGIQARHRPTENCRWSALPEEVQLRRRLGLILIITGRMCMSAFIGCDHHPRIFCKSLHPFFDTAVFLGAPVIASAYIDVKIVGNQIGRVVTSKHASYVYPIPWVLCVLHYLLSILPPLVAIV